MKNGILFAALFSTVLLVSGCATTSPSYQQDIDALNARVSTMQGQLATKEEELTHLQSQLREKENALSQAESEKRALSQRMDSMESQLAEERMKKAAKPAAPKYDSDLK